MDTLAYEAFVEKFVSTRIVLALTNVTVLVSLNTKFIRTPVALTPIVFCVYSHVFPFTVTVSVFPVDS